VNWRAIRALMRKDLLAVRRSPIVMLPLIILPVILIVVIPAGLGLAARLLPDVLANESSDLQQLLESLPPSVRDDMAGLSGGDSVMIAVLVYLFAPMYLIVPMMVSAVIAADSFVGERERKTLEALLHTPLTNKELLLAKMLSSWTAALAVTLGTFILYSLVVNLAGWQAMGGLFFPNLTWLLLAFWVAPAVAGFGLAVTVLISSRVKTFQEASQLGGIVVLPIVVLLIAQLAGVVFLGPAITFVLGAVIWVLDAGLLWFGVKTFRREELLARL
jgi:ABC-2 type transport system permease protein